MFAWLDLAAEIRKKNNNWMVRRPWQHTHYWVDTCRRCLQRQAKKIKLSFMHRSFVIRFYHRDLSKLCVRCWYSSVRMQSAHVQVWSDTAETLERSLLGGQSIVCIFRRRFNAHTHGDDISQIPNGMDSIPIYDNAVSCLFDADDKWVLPCWRRIARCMRRQSLD